MFMMKQNRKKAKIMNAKIFLYFMLIPKYIITTFLYDYNKILKKK